MDRFKQTVVRGGLDFAVLLYDLKLGALVAPITDYSFEMSDTMLLTELTVTKEISHLRQFYAFLISLGKNIKDIDDDILEEFKGLEYDRVMLHKTSKHVEAAAQATVNDKLRRVYQWISWLQATKRLPNKTLGGAGSKVVAPDLLLSKADRRIRLGRGTAHYPKAYRLPAGSSKHKTPFRLSEEHLEKLNAELLSTPESDYLAHRNTLFADIAVSTGLRRGSFNSLLTTQFDRDEINANGDSSFLVRPSRQKFGYADTFEFPVWLALRICDFIDTYRKRLVSDKRAGTRVHMNHVFLSSRNARPISDRAITKLISAGMRKVGAPKGNANHALRAKYASDQVDSDIEARLDSGQDTSTNSVSASIAQKLGHKHRDSYFAYVSHAQSRRAANIQADRSKKLADQRDRIKELESELKTLKELNSRATKSN